MGGSVSYAEEVHSKVTGSLIESDTTQDSISPNEQNSSEGSNSNNVLLPQTGEWASNLWFFVGCGIIMTTLGAGYYKCKEGSEQ